MAAQDALTGFITPALNGCFFIPEREGGFMEALTRMFDDMPVRVIMRKGEPWFVAKDVADALGYSDTNKMTSRLESEDSISAKLAGMNMKSTIINESGLYDAIIGSIKPEAKRFKRWITKEVLPSIRKTGSYAIPKELKKESTITRNLLTKQWQDHGASAPYHYINLTKLEYQKLYGDRLKKKANMTEEELAYLRVFESVECFKLLKNPEITGYHELADSIDLTAKQLPMFTVSAIK